MNILPKKRWHVRTKDNIARVRKDEAEAAEKEKEELRRVKLAEQEARLRVLRQKSNLPSPHTSNDDKEDGDVEKNSTNIFTESGNINFFKDVEAGIKVSGVNKDHEKEAKEEKEAYEKKIGLLTYLGQDTMEATGGKEWYEDSSKSLSTFGKDKKTDDDEVHYKNKERLDPLASYARNSFPIRSDGKTSLDSLTPDAIREYSILVKRNKKLLKRLKHHKNKKSKKCKVKKCKKNKSYPSDDDTEDNCKRKSKKCKRKRTSHLKSDEEGSHSEMSHKIGRSDDSEDNDRAEELKKSKLAQLRKERLRRETVEKKRAERLLQGKDPDAEDQPKVELPYKQKYSSQFNPHIAKQNERLSHGIDNIK